MKTKRKLKAEVKYFLVFFIFLICICIYLNDRSNTKEYESGYVYQFSLLGYTEDEVDILVDNYSENRLKTFLKGEYNEYYLTIFSEPYFIDSYFDDYFDYFNLYDVSISEAIASVNLGLEREYYEDFYFTDVTKSELMIVNKYNKLPDSYEPGELTSISSKNSWGDAGSQQLVSVVYDAFFEMSGGIKADEDITLMVSSSYRTYETQNSLYTTEKDKYGFYYADTVAARAGHSEHETGYALDILSLECSNKSVFTESKTYSWLINNSYKYGFILRYPEGKENYTGFSFEPWHFRYVGIDVATYIYTNDITFDEYYEFFIR